MTALKIEEVPEATSASIAPWVFVGIGVSTAIASGVFFGLSLDRQSTLDEWESGRQGSERPSDYDSVLSEELTFRTLGWTAAGVSAASLLTAGIWWWLDSDSETKIGLGPTGIQVFGTY